jgi:hypothetical protein
MAVLRCDCCDSQQSLLGIGGPENLWLCTNPTCKSFRWLFCSDCLKRLKAPKKGFIFKDKCCPYCETELKHKSAYL